MIDGANFGGPPAHGLRVVYGWLPGDRWLYEASDCQLESDNRIVCLSAEGGGALLALVVQGVGGQDSAMDPDMWVQNAITGP